MSALACNPALNWREVPLSRITVLLPCKPDRAQRFVNLGPTQTSMQMAGCEAAGVLYAVSHVHLSDISQVTSAQSAWQKASLSSVSAETVQHRSIKRSQALATLVQGRAGPSSASASLDVLNVQGRNTNGSQVQAQLAWLSQGTDVYHLAVYGTQLDPEHVDWLFSEVKLQ